MNTLRLFAAMLLFSIFISGCENTTPFVAGVAGSASQQTPVLRNTQGNEFGYYEYLPQDFNSNKKYSYPIIFYWNGANAIKGNGREDIGNLLTQGLSQYINEGKHYPAIVITGMLPDSSNDDIHGFVEYILKRYKKNIDLSRVYMTGFSAGGGVTLRYVAKHPEHIAAYIPIAAAIAPPSGNQPSAEMAKIPSWFIHNSGDMVVEIWRSNMWNKALRDIGGDHRITRPDQESHYAWQYTYSSKEIWKWLLLQKKKI